jgi:hypothetical protein
MRWQIVLIAVLIGCGNEGAVGPPAPQVSRLEIAPDTGQLLPGHTRQLSAAAYGSTGSLISAPPVTWEVDDGTVARITTAGLLTALAPGQAKVTVRAGTVSATGVYDVRIFGTYTLLTANGASVPVVASRVVACPPTATGSGTVTVHGGSFRFDAPTPGVPSPQRLVQAALTVVEDCGNSSSTYYGSIPSQVYTLRSGQIEFGTDLGYPFRTARLSKDTITLRWKPELSDSIEFKFVKK